MQKFCSGAFDEKTLRKIAEDHANRRIPMGTCAKCGRLNVIARNKAGHWVTDSHTVPEAYSPGKRMSKLNFQFPGSETAE
jgi:hypothetical protein